MKSSTKESGQKSTNSLGHDFWKFYLANKTIIDKIIYFVARKFQNVMPPEDMHSEILVRLHKYDFLERYDETRGVRWNTYLTCVVRGLAMHVVSDYAKQGGHNLGTKKDPGLTTQLLDSSLNHMPEEGDLCLNLSSEDSTEENILYSELVQLISKNLYGRNRKIFLHCLEDLHHTDIAKIMGISPQCLCWNINMIKETLKSILKKMSVA